MTLNTTISTKLNGIVFVNVYAICFCNTRFFSVVNVAQFCLIVKPLAQRGFFGKICFFVSSVFVVVAVQSVAAQILIKTQPFRSRSTIGL